MTDIKQGFAVGVGVCFCVSMVIYAVYACFGYVCCNVGVFCTQRSATARSKKKPISWEKLEEDLARMGN
jgi:hypothetical protein